MAGLKQPKEASRLQKNRYDAGGGWPPGPHDAEWTEEGSDEMFHAQVAATSARKKMRSSEGNDTDASLPPSVAENTHQTLKV